MPHVLIVDDDLHTREFLQVVLTDAGYGVLTARHGLEALDVMRQQRPDVVLLDIDMPVMDGYQFRARQLRDPALADVPVLAITGVFDTAQVAETLATACLPKSVEVEELLAEVSAASARVGMKNLDTT